MGEFLVRRLLLAIPTLLLSMTLIFVLARIAPGDPALVILGDQATKESLDLLRAKLGLDEPLLVQYRDFLGGILTGDLGRSLVTGKSVWSELLAVLPYTIELTLAALFLGVLFGVPLGVYAAVHRNLWPDMAARLFSLAGLSFPAFVTAILLLLVFAIQLPWFPVISAPRVDDPIDRLRNLVLPAFNLGLIMTAYVTRVARSSMLNVLGEDYIRTARAKGIGGSAVLWRHALRNAMIPVATVVGLYLGTMLGNSVLTEIVFNRPGLGKLLLGALGQRDYTMLQGLMVFFAGVIVLANAATDIAYGIIDPRVRYKS
jgi:ABC-type dipeptide/oligopeptide/nickel transport system permease component